MAFFNRIFGGNKKREATSTSSQQESLPFVWLKHFEIMPENCKFRNFEMKKKLKLFLGNVRVVLFRECDKKGKKLLFDSSTVEKVRLCPEKENKDTIFTESTDGWGFKYLQPPSKDVR